MAWRRLALFVVSLTAAGGVQAAQQPSKLSFNRDIRPILSENCFQCHGPDSNRRKAELRLDIREAAVEAMAFVPGDTDKSEMIRRVFSTDEDEHMPPVDSNRSLTAAQKELLKRWVKEGAPYEAHWAYSPPTRPDVPKVKARPAPQNPIDAFILATLERENLPPAREADRRTLIRRLSLDLTGLPPESKDVEAFVASRDPQAYEKLVQRYLSSPHFGERMAIPWLDLVRFADTIGFHNDVPLRVWPYRDYVINAFNQNLPFDQFTREQLAGDLLPDSTITQRVASGYNRIHRISGEGGIQDKEYFAKYSADRVRTTATVWMGSTLACAECHDHKFDPFTAKDFYRFAAIFSDLKEKGAYNLSGGFTRENLTEETIFETPDQKRRLESLEAEIETLTAEMKAVKNEELADGRAAWEAATLAADAAGTLAWTVVRPAAVESPAGTPFTFEDEDNSVIPGGENPVNDTYVVTLPAPQERITGMRLEVIQDSRFPGDEVARSGSMFFISEIEVAGISSGASSPQAIRLVSSRTSGTTERGHPAAAAIDANPATSVSFVRKRGGGIALQFAEPWRGGPDARLTMRIRHSDQHPYQNLGRFRLAIHTGADPDAHPDSVPENVLKALKMAAAERRPAQEKEIATYYRTVAPELAGRREKLADATNARDYLIDELPSMPVSKSVEPRPIRLLPRGNWMDDSGEIVEPGVPGFMRQIEPTDGKRVSRLDFAEWLVAPDNPLTARTFVNRLWRLYFGAGLSRTLEDLGSQGEWPTHPGLLDWLAVEFRDSGWNVKHMVGLIVTSRTYKQSSQTKPAIEERDPPNRFLARQSRFRLDAELVRDNVLAISGLLVRDTGGPSAKPYQPPGYYAALNFPKREYVPDIDEGLWRRGVYTHWQRTFLLPSFIAFDAPSRDECTANRSTSNTPLQALVLLNDPSFVEAARVLAEKTMREGGGSFRARLAWAFTRAVARPPTRHETKLLETLYEKQRARYERDEAAARELISTGEKSVPKDLPLADVAAWTAVSRAILNLHETITRL
ncbi:MAG: PSD1 and planctomycete cytochrome C domain-containing protein [Opitutaceae bacterium]